MASAKLQQRLDQYKAIYSELKSDLKWKVTDQRTLMMIASMYVVNKRPFDKERFLKLSEAVKQAAGTFSPLRSAHRYTFAAMFDVPFEEPETHIRPFFTLYEKMTGNGFKKSIFTYLSALILLTKYRDEHDHDSKINRALSIYKGMKDKHVFLTSAGDYPLSVLLAGSDMETGELIDYIEAFYQKLNQAGFRKGNDLQFLSHILSLMPEQDSDQLVARSLRIYDELTKKHKRPKPVHYPEIGLLALLENGEKDIDAITIMAGALNSDKLFRWQKDMNLKTAVNLYMSEKTEDPALLDTGLYQTLEAVIQAQQTAAIAIMTSSAAASQANGS